MKTSRKKARTEKSPDHRVTDFAARRESLRRDLLRKIREWARVHEACPLAGCRRNKRCLAEDKCRAVSNEPFTEAEAAEVRRQLAALEDSADPSAERSVPGDATGRL